MIRPARQDDVPFIASGWKRSFASSDWALMCTPKDADHVTTCEHCGGHRMLTHKRRGMVEAVAGPTYWTGQTALVNRLLPLCNVSVLEAEDGLLDGFIAREHTRPVIHYVFVRAEARGRGVARALVADLVPLQARYTHRSRGLRGGGLPSGWEFDPYVLMGVT